MEVEEPGTALKSEVQSVEVLEKPGTGVEEQGGWEPAKQEVGVTRDPYTGKETILVKEWRMHRSRCPRYGGSEMCCGCPGQCPSGHFHHLHYRSVHPYFLHRGAGGEPLETAEREEKRSLRMIKD